MRILFLTLVKMSSFDDRNIYMDLVNEFINRNHLVDIVCPESLLNRNAFNVSTNNRILPVNIGEIEKTSIFKKGINTILLEKRYLKHIKKYLVDTKYDLVLYSTPPITFSNIIKYLKEKDGAVSYLMLKDIFPQNAVDLGLLNTKGIKSLIYKYFKWKEKTLYSLSDYIGCMSQGNINYILEKNKTIPVEKVELCPNSIKPSLAKVIDIKQLRTELNLPIDKTIIIYGGNLGLPQNIDFLINVVKSLDYREDLLFLVIGSGTEYNKLLEYKIESNNQLLQILSHIPKDDYDKYVLASNIGLILLDYRFSIPNFPSRLLSYMDAGKPIFCSVDTNTDVGSFVTEMGIGVSSINGDLEDFSNKLDHLLANNLAEMGNKSRLVLEEQFDVSITANIILKHFWKGEL